MTARENIGKEPPLDERHSNAILQLQPGDHIVCEGDSATNRGTGPAGDTWPYLRLMNWHECWPEFLGELLFCGWPHLNTQVTNAAVGGSTCRDVAARLDERVLPLEPDWVLLTLGGNDVNHGIAPDEFRSVLDAYAGRLHEECGARTVFVGVYCDAPHAPSKMTWDRIGPYYDAFRDLAARRDHVEALVLWEALGRQGRALARQWEHHTLFTGPDQHWNAVAQRMIALEVMRAFGLVAPDAIG